LIDHLFTIIKLTELQVLVEPTGEMFILSCVYDN